MNPFTISGMPIIKSNLVPEKPEVTRRVEWATRNADNTITFRHDLRQRGSIYETTPAMRQAIIIPGMGIVMRPNDAAAIRISEGT